LKLFPCVFGPVFITYANEVDDPNDQHIRTVVQISQTLRKNSIDISVDMLEEQVQSLSVSDWLEEKLTSVGLYLCRRKNSIAALVLLTICTSALFVEKHASFLGGGRWRLTSD